MGALSTRQLFLTYLQPHWRQVMSLGWLLLVGAGLTLVSPQLIRAFIDAARAGQEVTTLLQIAGLVCGVALVTQLVSVAEAYVAENLGWQATNALRVDLTRHCLTLDPSFHARHPPGELIERVDGDVSTLAHFFSRFALRLLANVLFLVGVLIALLWEDWRIGLVALFFSLVALLTLNAVRLVGQRAVQDRRQASGELFGFLEERLAGLVDIQSNGAQPSTVQQLVVLGLQLYQRAQRAVLMTSLLYGLTGLVLTLSLALTLVLGATFFQGGAMTLGTVYLLVHYVLMLREPLGEITREAHDFQQAGACLARVRELVGTPRRVSDGDQTLPAGPLAVTVDAVSFHYATTGPETSAEPALHEISLALPAGRILGVLGRTGSGKSTLARLLARQYDPTQGTIALAGQPLPTLLLAELRRRVGVVTQEVHLLRASLRANLTLFDPAIVDARLIAVLTELGLSEWFERLPHGLDSELGPGGVGLSAGEAQLLALARIFLHDPGLIILDEAAARLDPVTEARLEHALQRLLTKRTAIIIAHRLTTIQRADDIMILEDGRVVEIGPRLALSADPSSRFARLLAAGLEEVLA